MVEFEDLSVAESLEVAVGGADHLGVAHAAHVAAARVLARRIDALESDDFTDDKGRLDNVSIPSFLKYLDALGLSVEKAAPGKRVGAVRPPRDELAAMRAQLGAG